MKVHPMLSVPIRGLFNLTIMWYLLPMKKASEVLSVPIRGLFNLTINVLSNH